MPTHNDETLQQRYEREHREFERMSEKHTQTELHEFAVKHAPKLAEGITRLCGAVIAKGMTGILEEVCRIQQERDSIAAQRNKLLVALKGVLPYMEAAESAGLVGDEGCHWPVEEVRAAIQEAEQP